MAESVEYRALLECSDHLVIALKFDPMTLGMELAAKGLVPPRDVSYRRTTLEQAQELAGSILDRVKLAPSRYRDFVEIVSKHQWMEDFVQTLENAYHGKTGRGTNVHIKKDSSDREDESNPESACDEFSCDLTDIPHGKSSSLDISNPIVRFSDLDEDDREDLLAQIDELTEKIELEFGKLIDKVLSSFWDSGVDHNRVIVTLIGKEKLLKEEDLAGTRNIDDVFKIIRPYCSYFNYDLIETLIQIHGSRQAKIYFKKYIQAFSSYCRAIPCVEEMCSNQDTKSKRTKLKFKLDFDRQQLKPDAVRSIKRKIAKQLGMRPSALFLCGIKEGCILLEFLVPTFIAEQLFPLSKAQRVGLQRDIKALSIECEALNVNIKLNVKSGSKKATRNSYSENSSQTSDTVGSPNKFVRWMRQSFKNRNKENQRGRLLRRMYGRHPKAILRHYRPQDPSLSELNLEIQGTDTPPMLHTAPKDQLYNVSQISGASHYSGMSGVSQNHGPHRMPRFGDPSHLGLPSSPSYPHHQSHSMQSTDSGYSNGHQVPYYPTAIHSPHSVINQQPQAHGSYPDLKSLSGFQCINCGHSITQQHQYNIDTFSFAPHLSQHPYPSYPQHPVSKPLQPIGLEQAHSTLSSHSGHSDKGFGRQSPASIHHQHIQHPSPHMQPLPVYQPVLQSQFISPNDVAVVKFALMHNRHCQIPGCCCYQIRELVEGARGGSLMPYHYNSPEVRNGRRVHRVNHQISSTDSDSDYTHTERRSRPPNLRLLSGEHNRNPNLHPHYHLTKKSHIRRVNPPANHRRSKSLSDLTPLREVPETPAKTPAIGGSVKADTPVYYCPPTIGEDGQEKPSSPIDRRCTNQPMLLRQISISADNIPVLCLNDCSFIPSPVAAAQSRRKGSSLQGELMQSMKPKISNKTPVDTAHQTLADSAPKSSLGIESSHYNRSLDDEVKEIMQSAPARDIQKTAPSRSPLLSRKRNESTNSSLLLSDPRIRHSISPLSIGSSLHIMPSRRSASPYETVVHRENGIVTETTEC